MIVNVVENDGIRMTVARMSNGAVRGAAIWEKDGRTFAAGAEKVNGEVTYEFTYSGHISVERVSAWMLNQLGGDEESEDFEGLFPEGE